MEIEVGKVIGGKYKLVRLLGRGGMGQVWVARHRTLEQDVAIKLMTPMDVDDDLAEGAETALARFQLEAQVAASLSKRSRNIVAVTDHGYEEGAPYLVMDLLQGEGLDALLDRDRILPPDRVATIVSQAARGLAAAHAEGVVHRDLKPANVFLTRDEDGKLVVKLVDFGIAGLERRPTDSKTPKLTGRGIVLGSPHYMSPEQARGLTEIDRFVDLWALSVVAYEALTGVMPFEGATPEDTIVRICMDTPKRVTEIRSSLPVALDAFFARAFSRNVADRFASADELAAAFNAAVQSEADDAPAPPARAPTAPIDLVVPAAQPRASMPDDETPLPPVTRSNRPLVFGILGAILLLSLLGVGWKLTHPGVDTTGEATTGVTSVTTTTATGRTIPPPPTDEPTSTTTAGVPSASARATATVRSTATAATGTATSTVTGTVTASATGTVVVVPPKPSASIDKGAIF